MPRLCEKFRCEHHEISTATGEGVRGRNLSKIYVMSERSPVTVAAWRPAFSFLNATTQSSFRPGALFRVGTEWYAYVIKNSRAERRGVEVLRRAGRSAAIAAGLAVDDTVIVYPSDRIAPGVRVASR
jgi:hypothetical protein